MPNIKPLDTTPWKSLDPIEVPSEGAQINIQGEAGVTYDVEAAPVLTGPWSVIATQSSASGIINLLDLEAVGDSRRFYRARVRR